MLVAYEAGTRVQVELEIKALNSFAIAERHSGYFYAVVKHDGFSGVEESMVDSCARGCDVEMGGMKLEGEEDVEDGMGPRIEKEVLEEPKELRIGR
ncbi:hypothetical protein F0562_014226 [Nyssa sinensis]|uniref:Uncharacterized protein n=1 Tax=Nyssa sinensis TaxID=561372 RepID=A0A5J4ZQI9_9ASTE|nr:hypothetical protein F0562_014226 [Nyssa sinensis]